ncbi:MAG: NYN domain-containing protein [Pseudomonadota bacterium]
MKTIAYIDGYNLYYGCLRNSRYKWLNLHKLFDTIINIQNPDSELQKIKYFTSDVKARYSTHGQLAQQAQTRYHNALLKCCPNIEIIKGYHTENISPLPTFQEGEALDRTQTTKVWRLEEKQTDVNIALEMYRDAIKSEAQQIVVVSNDTDLEPALKMIRNDLNDAIQNRRYCSNWAY